MEFLPILQLGLAVSWNLKFNWGGHSRNFLTTYSFSISLAEFSGFSKVGGRGWGGRHGKKASKESTLQFLVRSSSILAGVHSWQLEGYLHLTLAWASETLLHFPTRFHAGVRLGLAVSLVMCLVLVANNLLSGFGTCHEFYLGSDGCVIIKWRQKEIVP